MNKSKVLKNNQYHWTDVERKQYKTETTNFKDIHRYGLLGEKEDEQQLNSQTRYFEIQPGGYSSLELHRHPHTVVIIRGKGSLILENEIHDIDLHDVIFISPETIHQFHADQDDHLGFICVVDRYRDRPTIPSQDQLDVRITNPEVREKIKL